MGMFCFQCEQTAKGKGCDAMGVCGKTPEVATLQDLLVHAAKGIAIYGQMAREIGVKDKDTDLFLVEALFTTVTNVDFDPERIQKTLLRGFEIKEKIKDLFLNAYKKKNGRDFEANFRRRLTGSLRPTWRVLWSREARSAFSPIKL